MSVTFFSLLFLPILLFFFKVPFLFLLKIVWTVSSRSFRVYIKESIRNSLCDKSIPLYKTYDHVYTCTSSPLPRCPQVDDAPYTLEEVASGWESEGLVVRRALVTAAARLFLLRYVLRAALFFVFFGRRTKLSTFLPREVV